MNDISTNRTIDDVLLERTVEQREKFIAILMPEGKLPEDPKEKALVLKALDGIDKVAISRKRIRIEDRTAANNEKVAAMLAHVYKGVSVSQNPYLVNDVTDVAFTEQMDIPTIPEHLAAIHLVEGETSVNPRQMSYKEFAENNIIPPPSEE